MKFIKTYWFLIFVFILAGFLVFLFNTKKEINIKPSLATSTTIATALNTSSSHETTTSRGNQSNDTGLNQSLSKLLFKVKTAVSPKGLAFSLDNKEIWVTSLMNKNTGAVVHDVFSGKITSNISLQNYGGVEVIFSKDGSRAYISQMETASVFELDSKTKKILRVFKTNSSWTKILALSSDETKLYASNWVGNNVSEIDLKSGTLIRNIKTVKTPRGVYPTKDGKYLYVAGYDKGELQKINLTDLSSKILYNQGKALRHIVVDENKNIMYISDMGKKVILKLDLKTDLLTEFVFTDINPNTIALSPDKKLLFVSCRGKNFSPDDYYQPGPEWGTVLIFDTNKGKLVDAIIGGNQPTALDVSPDGKILVFSDFLDSQLEFYQIPDYKELKNNNSSWLTEYKKAIIK